MGVRESDVLAGCLELLTRHQKVAFAFRMNVGAARTLVLADGVTRERFIRFGFPGCSDIIGMLKDGRFLAVECKRPGEKPTDTQQAFLDVVNTAGVAWWVDDVQQLHERLQWLEMRA